MSLLSEAENNVMLRRRKAVAYWLLAGVAIIMIQVLLGGITRLTGSGLSIAEWKPILGVLPPMNEQAWNAAFDLYKEKAAGQFASQNSDYTLSDFKAIYFWEWMHREWARVVLSGVFLVGFFYFLAKKYFERWMVQPMVLLFVLGGLQGAVGWIMVMSGLNPEDTHVSHITLAMHFMFALVLLCYTFWFALKLLIPETSRLSNNKLKNFSLLLLVLLAVQLVYGAFMAGLKAAPVAATWPDVNGTYLPENVNSFGGQEYSGFQIIIDNPIMVHYIHRTMAYLLFVLVIIWFTKSRRLAKSEGSSLLNRASVWTIVLISLQVLLGVITVLNGHLMTQNKFLQFEWFAELHQMVAICLLMNLVLNYYLFKKKIVVL
jgi:heme a synthase